MCSVFLLLSALVDEVASIWITDALHYLVPPNNLGGLFSFFLVPELDSHSVFFVLQHNLVHAGIGISWQLFFL